MTASGLVFKPACHSYFTVDRLPYTPKLRATVGNCLWTISQVCSASSASCLTSVSEIKKYNVSQLEQICSKSVSEPEYQSKLKTIRKNCVTKKSQSTRKKLCHNPNFRFDSCHSPCSVNGPRSSCENKTKI